MPHSKRLLDLTLALIALVFLSPAFLIVALILKFREKGPVLYGHERIGRDGRKSRCLKFRTMAVDGDRIPTELLDRDPEARAEWESRRKLTRDPPITTLGRFVRKTSLDELPQLFNILLGEMSVVGPRPIVQQECVYYGEYFRDYLSVLPGLTGPWQIGGRSAASYETRVALDVEYARNRTFFGDLVTIAKTVRVVLIGQGAE